MVKGMTRSAQKGETCHALSAVVVIESFKMKIVGICDSAPFLVLCVRMFSVSRFSDSAFLTCGGFLQGSVLGPVVLFFFFWNFF